MVPYTEKSLAASIASLKWNQKIPCFSCGALDFYYLKDWSRKCRSCKSKESAQAHTAFHRQNIKIDTAMDILLSIQYRMATSTFPYLSPVAHVREEFGLPRPTLYKFLKRISSWLPTHYRKAPAEAPMGALYNSVRNKEVYYSLYNLLFDELVIKREPAEIVSLLTVKEIQPIELTSFFRYLHEIDTAGFRYDKRGFYQKGDQLKNKRTYLG